MIKIAHKSVCFCLFFVFFKFASCRQKEDHVTIIYSGFDMHTITSVNCTDFEKKLKTHKVTIQEAGFADSLKKAILSLTRLDQNEYRNNPGPDTRAKIIFKTLSDEPICIGNAMVKINNEYFVNTEELRTLIKSRF